MSFEPDLELRLRERIDELRMERDDAVDALWEVRAELADERDRRRKAERRVRELEASREMWRGRARVNLWGARHGQ